MLNISYFDRQKDKVVQMSIPADVVAIQISGEYEPPISVNVNTDAVLVDNFEGKRLGALYYDTLLHEALLEAILEDEQPPTKPVPPSILILREDQTPPGI